MLKYPGSLHNHTDYSNIRLRDSINHTEELMNYAIELGHSVIAYTEHECLSNSVLIEKVAKNKNIKVIRGNEIYLCRNGLSAENFDSTKDKYYHFILLAKDYQGYLQMCELSTKAWNQSYISRRMRRVPTYYSDLIDIIGKNPGHLIGSTACLGSTLGQQLLIYRDLLRTQREEEANNLYKQIKQWCISMENLFLKGNFYLEIQPSANLEQEFVNKEIIKISKELDIPYIITTDSHYKNKEDAAAHATYLKSQDGDREVSDFYATTYMMNTEELESYLDYMTTEELQTAYQNINIIAKKCEDYSILKPLKIPCLKWKIPNLKIIPQKYYDLIPNLHLFTNSSFEGDKILARAIVDKVIKDKTLQTQETYDEINLELDITMRSSQVNKAHWSAYFLNLQGIIETVWDADSIVLPGRGSGVGFLLLHVLDIVQINPLRETTKTYNWRFLNPDRTSILDVDFDISGLKRNQVLKKFREVYGEDRVANVATFGKETAKAAILTAARGLGIDNDEAQYLASLVPADRGIVRTLKQCYYGDKDNNLKPVTEFVKNMSSEQYQELWKVAQKIEGTICRTGIHAGGVIFVDEPFTNSTALMRAPDGTIITQLDLHAAEDVSLIKYDALSVEAADKIQICLESLQKYGFIDKKLSLKEAYEETIGVYNLERTSPDMWKLVWEHKILSLFQMEQQSGIQGIELTHPQSVDDLAILNSAIRLMAQDKDSESPLEKLARFKKDISQWYQEMKQYGLTEKEIKVLEPIIKISYGLCIAQEQFMQLVQLPECGGFSLTWADSLRKAIAKKNPAAYDKLEIEFFEKTKEKKCSKNLCNYVWNVLIAMNRGYGFNSSHTLAYSIVGLQEMNLAYKYPIIFWNCSNLIVNSGGGADVGDKNVDYGKMAKALGEIISADIKVSLVDINKSGFTFEPDYKNNQILFGLKALGGVNSEIIEKIFSCRPYKSFKDFLNKVSLPKIPMISLIKSGAFDKLEQKWAEEMKIEARYIIMAYYLSIVCEPKNKLTLQNFNGLIQKDLVPKDFDFAKQIFEFNKYLKKYKKYQDYYIFDDRCSLFYKHYFEKELDKIESILGYECIKQKTWEKIYKEIMKFTKKWLKENQQQILNQYNTILFKEIWDKYAKGNLSSWEMDSLCFYFHEHELAEVDKDKYGIVDFENLSPISAVDYYFKRNGRQIPIFKTYKIIGTVIEKNDNRSSISLLTTGGVVNVKFTKEYYSMFNKQISEKQEDGSKKVLEKSWFGRGNKLMITGYRRGNDFVGKTYKRTPTHQLYKINLLDNNELELTHERARGYEEKEGD